MSRILSSAAVTCCSSLLLVNRRHPLRQSVAPDRLTPFRGTGIFLERRTALVLENLFSALDCGSSILPVSGYRTREEQSRIYTASLLDNGRDFTEKYIALPDCSEHQTGLAIDLALNRGPVDSLRPDFPQDGICGRFREKMTAYGFTERYPKGKESVTGIAAEPWHFRYVGLPHAALMKRHDFCLEEYIDYIRSFPSEGPHLITDIQNKSFELFWINAETEDADLDMPSGLPFQISDTNAGGCIVTLWR